MASNQVDHTMIDGVHYRQTLQFYGYISLFPWEQLLGKKATCFSKPSWLTLSTVLIPCIEVSVWRRKVSSCVVMVKEGMQHNESQNSSCIYGDHLMVAGAGFRAAAVNVIE